MSRSIFPIENWVPGKKKKELEGWGRHRVFQTAVPLGASWRAAGPPQLPGGHVGDQQEVGQARHLQHVAEVGHHPALHRDGRRTVPAAAAASAGGATGQVENCMEKKPFKKTFKKTFLHFGGEKTQLTGKKKV